MRAIIAVLVAVALLPWFSGCTAPTSRDIGQTESSGARALSALRKGMTAEEVRAAWGEPQRIAPLEATAGSAEVWTYRNSYVGGVQSVQTGFTTYTRENPFTGAPETVSEPVYQLEEVVINETFELLIFDGRLLEWKKSAAVRRRYS